MGDQCLVDYGAAFDSPFTHSGVCIPTYPSWPSRKLLTRQFGTMATGTNGVGWIMCQASAANDQANVFYTTGSYTGDPTTALATSGTGIVTAQNGQSPYVSANFGAGTNLYQQRCAIMAVRIRYIGTDLNMSGSVYPITSANHAVISGQSYQNLRVNYSGSVTQPIDRKQHTTRWGPVTPDEMEYSTTPNPNTTLGIPMAIVVTGYNPAVAGTFEWEIITHHEVIGNGLDTTPSYSSSKLPDLMSRITGLGAQAARHGGVQRVAKQLVGVAARVASGYVRQRFPRQNALHDDL
jgi:hypothetical protein